MKGEIIMEKRNGEKTLHVPTLVLVAGFLTVGHIATEICKVISGK